MENLDNDTNKNVSLSLIAEYGVSDSDSDDTETRSNENTGNEDSDAAELSEMVLKNNLINACAHGPLSRSNILDDLETSRHMIIDNCESGVVEYEVTEYRDEDSDSGSSPSSDSSDSDVDSVKDIEEISSGDEIDGGKKDKQPPKVHEELGLDDLPPIEDLAISLPAQETTAIGTIASVVDRLVIVRAFPDTPAVDLDSVLFLEKGAVALGKVFDVFGPVTEPHYCVRFNSQEHIKARGVKPGMDVFIAPQSQHTNYVFLSELMKMKGSDASWLHDIEPPPQQVEYSDDEEERRANKTRKQQNRQNKQLEPDGETSKQAPRKPDNQPKRRPTDSSSRFGSGPSRGKNPFGARRSNTNVNQQQRPGKFLADSRSFPAENNPRDYNTQMNYNPHYAPQMFPAPFNPNMPPPFMGHMFHFGGNPRMNGMMPMPVQFRQDIPTFGSNYCHVAGPHPQWVNNGQPPPPGT